MSGERHRELRHRQRDRGAEHGTLHGRRGALRFDSLEREHGWLREHAAVADGQDRTLLEVRGERALETFGGLVTQHVEALPEGRAAYAYMLTAKGRPVAEMRVLRPAASGGDEQRLLLDLPTACREQAEEHFGRYLPPRLATVAEREDLVRLTVLGPEADPVLQTVLDGVELPASPLDVVSTGEGAAVVVRREPEVGSGHDLYVPAGEAADVWEALVEAAEAAGGGPAGLEAREVLRVELGIPLYGREISLDVLPQETGQTDRAVSFEKGCYTGQEVVARIHYRGQVNRHLRGLRLPEDLEPPALDTPLHREGRERGTVTTALRSPRLGPVALAFVRREVEVGSEVGIGDEDGPAARVAELPLVPYA